MSLTRRLLISNQILFSVCICELVDIADYCQTIVIQISCWHYSIRKAITRLIRQQLQTDLCDPSVEPTGLKTQIVRHKTSLCEARRFGRAISCELTRSLASAANAMIDVHNFRFQSSDGGVSTSTTGSRSSAPSCPRPMTREYEFLFFRFIFFSSLLYPLSHVARSSFHRPPLSAAPFAPRLTRRASLLIVLLFSTFRFAHSPRTIISCS